MSGQEVDLNDIYEELIKLKDTLDKIEDICQTIIEYDLTKKPSIFDNNINEMKQNIEELRTCDACRCFEQNCQCTDTLSWLLVSYYEYWDIPEEERKTLEAYPEVEQRKNLYLQINSEENRYKLISKQQELELSSYNQRIASIWYVYIHHPRVLKKNLIAQKNGQPCLNGKDWDLISKNTCITIKASQLLKFYYKKKQRLKEIYETYKDQEHIEELLKDIDEEDINTIWEHECNEDFIKQYNAIWEHNEKYFIKQIEEKDNEIYEKDEQIIKLERKLQYIKNKNKELEKNQITNIKPVETTNLLDIEYNPFDNLT